MDLSLTATRAELVSALEEAGYVVYNGLPRSVERNRTVAMLTPGEPYLTSAGAAFGTHLLHLEVWLGFEAADNDAFSEETDPHILALIAAIPDRWLFVDAAAPFSATDLGGIIVCRIRIDTLVTKEETP